MAIPISHCKTKGKQFRSFLMLSMTLYVLSRGCMENKNNGKGCSLKNSLH
uniref:Uncharacterized protein n=1 Tax=Anguilla anguilla TaxID=7936 RepID=A0A0E9T3R1_ANGAN